MDTTNDKSTHQAAQQALEQRLTELEIKAAFTEDLLDQLDQVIVRQQQQIDALAREVSELRQPSTDGGVGTARSLRDELPPHF
ncbi:MAG: SlyX family protein [Chitinophagaceae bacterium]|nr:SlyX family protein [Polaromonas sp.]